MLRLTLLSPALTEAQRLYRFAGDEAIEPIPDARTREVAARVGGVLEVLRGPERRCLDTAAALGLVAEPCEQLRAWSAGTWTGLTLEWVAAHDAEGLRAWQSDPDAAPHGGETLNAMLARVATWLEAQTSASGRRLVIADASVLRAIVLHVLGAPPASFWRLDIAPLSMSMVQHAGGQWRLRTLGLLTDQAHTLAPTPAET